MDMFTNKRVVDLTRMVTPGQERFRMDITTFNVEDLAPGFKRPAGDWYILQEWTVCSHIGTHIESPYHHIKEGRDIAGLRLDQAMGEAVILDFRTKKAGEAITAADLKALGDVIKEGDIILVHTGFDAVYNQPNYNRPYLAFDAIEWLIERKIKCLGIDASGVEQYQAAEQPGHKALFGANIPVIEELTHLEDLRQQRVYFMALPLPIRGADSCPVRAVAIEEA